MMTLDPKQREQVRLSILRYGLSLVSVSLLRSYLRGDGFSRISDEQVALEVQYLQDKKYLTAEDKGISPENELFRTTADGRDYLAKVGQE
jgi:hypothetical protein